MRHRVHKPRAARRFRALHLLAFAWVCLTACGVPAQEEAAPDPASTLTLHVYTNLIQIPVLVLGPALDYVPSVDPKNLTVTLDNGRPFHPLHVHPEGDEPIALAFVVDLSGEQPERLASVSDALPRAVKRALLPHDEVSLYTLDCNIVRHTVFGPPDPSRLSDALEHAVTVARQARKHPRICTHSPQLLDALAIAIDELWHRPGRRVVVAVTHGVDGGSRFKPEEVRHLATGRGVAIFGIVPYSTFEGGTAGPLRGGGSRSSLPGMQGSGTAFARVPELATFDTLCQLTGGVLRRTPEDGLKLQIEQTVKNIRGRTIIEFPRPADTVAGDHSIEVHLAKSRAVLRPAGISVPVPDAKILADPTTIRPAESTPPPSPSTSQPPA